MLHSLVTAHLNITHQLNRKLFYSIHKHKAFISTTRQQLSLPNNLIMKPIQIRIKFINIQITTNWCGITHLKTFFGPIHCLLPILFHFHSIADCFRHNHMATKHVQCISILYTHSHIRKSEPNISQIALKFDWLITCSFY